MTLIAPALLAAAGQGDPAARERLLALCAPLVKGVARRTLSRDYLWELEDAEQTSRLALVACTCRHSVTGAAGFPAYAATAALRDCLRERRLWHRGWVLPHEPAADAATLDLGEPAEDSATVPSAEAAALQDAEAAHLRAAVARLDSPLRETLSRRYGLDGREPATLREVAAELGVSLQAIQKREQRALAALGLALSEG